MKETKKAIMTMGLPASGKSYTLNNNYDTTGYVKVDPDEIKKEKADYTDENPSVYHEWSKKVAKARIATAMAEEKNLVIDGTGTNVEKMYKQVTELQAEGYEVTLLYVKVRLETAIERNYKRARTVPVEIIYEKFETVSTAFEILSTIANTARVINND